MATDEFKEKQKHTETEQETGEQDYQFMNQVIRKKPVNWQKIAARVGLMAASGVLIGVIGSFVCAKMLPVAQNVLGVENPGDKITIPADEEPTPQPQESVASASSELVAASSQENGAEPEETTSLSSADGETTSASSEETEDVNLQDQNAAGQQDDGEEENADVTLAEYRQLYRNMLAKAEDSEHALVQVSGITSEMDYFNQNYVNSRQISGLIVAKNESDLFILTEYRVVENVERIQVYFYDNSMADATFQKRDRNTGLCIVKVSLSSLPDETKKGLTTAPLGNSYTVSRGEPLLALGSPMGYSDSVAFGVVTSVTNKVTLYDNEYSILTTDIDGSTDGSGVLINLDGKIVGVIKQSLGSNGESSVTGLAISQIKGLIQSLSNNETVPYMGIAGQDVTKEITDRTGIPVGMLVTEIAEDSPAMLAGIKEYDVITEISGNPVPTVQLYHYVLSMYKAGDAVQIKAMRKGAEGYAEVTFDATVGEQ